MPAVRPLFGRDAERARLRALLAAGGGCLVLAGDAGIGKSALLEAAAAEATGRVLRAAGCEFEADIGYAALNQLLLPLRPQIGALCHAHRAALSVALGLSGGPPAERIVVATAVLLLLTRAASGGPLLVVVDDTHWLDQSSAAVLRFAARRLTGTGATLLAAVRAETPGPFDGLPLLEVGPLDERSSVALLAARHPGLPPDFLRDVLDRAQGNPLALLELPAAGASGPGRLQTHFAARVAALPAAARGSLLAAALGGAAAVEPRQLLDAERAGLIRVDRRTGDVHFRHPLVRAAVVEAASPAERRAAHRSLADRTTGRPEQLAWHLAEAADGPDEKVAALLETTAEAALRRGDVRNAVSALLRAAELSPDDNERGRRLAEAAYRGADVAGRLRQAPDLLHAAPDTHTSLEAASAAAYVLINGEGDVETAHRLLVGALRARGGTDRATAEALHTLLTVCWFGGRPDLWQPFHEALARLDFCPRVLALCAATFADPVRTAEPVLDELDTVIAGLHDETDPARIVRVGMAAFFVDRVGGCRASHWRVVEDGRRGGAVSSAILALIHLSLDDVFTGRWDEAAHLAEEGLALCDAHGYRLLRWPLWFGQAAIAAGRGEDDRLAELTDAMVEWAAPRGVRPVQWYACHTRALAALARRDFEDAYRQLSSISPPGLAASHVPLALWGILDLAEAAVRTGRHAEAVAHVEAVHAAGVDRLSARLALLAQAAAAVVADDADLFQRALAVPDGDRWPFDHARVRLLYGERLRRRSAVLAARAELTAALETFTRLRARPWIVRTEQELRAAGQIRRRTANPSRPLTPHEFYVAGLAAKGLTNKQIGELLGVSHRTIADYLYRIFPVLGVTSRAALRDALTALPEAPSSDGT